MGKRKLNRRQLQRVARRQRERTDRAVERDGDCDLREPTNGLGPEQQGLVIAHHGTQVEVETLTNPVAAGNIGLRRRCHLLANLGSLVTGDRVIWRDGEPTGVVVAVRERRNQLSRPDPHGELKTIAANIDQIIIVSAPLPEPHTQTIDRYLVAAETLGIRPIIMINKMDLLDGDHGDSKSIIDTITELYRGLGYPVIGGSTRSGAGLNHLLTRLVDNTSIFVGPSGVGKSSLINALIPDLNLQTGAVSAATGKGTHTTTAAQLFHFPGGGHLIDSPGVREFGLGHLSAADITSGFIEFRPFIGRCKFRDCRHRREPGCAIVGAFKAGQISRYRMSSYQALRDGGKPG